MVIYKTYIWGFYAFRHLRMTRPCSYIQDIWFIILFLSLYFSNSKQYCHILNAFYTWLCDKYTRDRWLRFYPCMALNGIFVRDNVKNIDVLIIKPKSYRILINSNMVAPVFFYLFVWGTAGFLKSVRSADCVQKDR